MIPPACARAIFRGLKQRAKMCVPTPRVQLLVLVREYLNGFYAYSQIPNFPCVHRLIKWFKNIDCAHRCPPNLGLDVFTWMRAGSHHHRAHTFLDAGRSICYPPVRELCDAFARCGLRPPVRWQSSGTLRLVCRCDCAAVA